MILLRHWLLYILHRLVGNGFLLLWNVLLQSERLSFFVVLLLFFGWNGLGGLNVSFILNNPIVLIVQIGLRLGIFNAGEHSLIFMLQHLLLNLF